MVSYRNNEVFTNVFPSSEGNWVVFPITTFHHTHVPVACPARTRNGKPVKSRKVKYDQHVATLTLEDTTEKSAGTYTCYASNSAGEVETSCMVQIQGT